MADGLNLAEVLAAASLRVNAARLQDSLAQLAEIGATPAGGVTRLALSDEDRRARDLFARWCREAGCTVRVDRMGNMFARRPGVDESAAPVLAGSHIDSQPAGGRYDGAYGVLAALEAVRTINDLGIRTRRPLEIVNWTNEEGARFAPAMLGAGVFSGAHSLEEGLSRQDAEGVTVAHALAAIGYAGDVEADAFPIAAAFEVHIEQGPLLEAGGETIGVVTGAQGQRWFEGRLSGRAAHAGTTPLSLRQDAGLGLARLVEAVHVIGTAHGPDARATVGATRLYPNSRNVVPGEADFTVEFRHPDDVVLDSMEAALARQLPGIAALLGLRWHCDRVLAQSPIVFDRDCAATVRRAASRLGYRQRDMISGAGHDSCHLSRIAPVAMIFIPCVDGISHNEAEAILPPWSEAGANVLLHCLLEAAGQACV